ncbi:MAG: TonB-dependent receptor, partial [Thalassotalea sp.]|nr:TonB-dependent receptor [Thalassotalea sp.]
DDKFGIAVSASHQVRESGSARAGVDGGWRRFEENGEGGWGSLPSAPTDGSADPHMNRPQMGDVYAVPQNLLYGFKEIERTRTNGQVTLQYQPIDALTATLDYTYSKLETETNQNIFSVWMNHGHSASEWTDPNSDGVRAPVYITENNTGVDNDTGALNYADLVSQVEESAQVNENESIGLNLAYDVNDNLSFGLDLHSSSAEAKPDSIYGNSNTIQMATNVRAATSIDFSSDFPVASVMFPSEVNLADYPAGTTNPLPNVSSTNPEGVRTTGTSFRNSYMKSEIDQLQLTGKYVFDDGIVESIDFGVARTETENRTAFAMAERPTWGGVGSVDDIDNQILIDSLSGMKGNFDNLPGDKSNMIDEFFNVDFKTFADIIGDNYGVPLNADGTPGDAAWPCGTQVCAPTAYTTDNRTTEESNSAFVQANLTFEIADMPANVSFGVRWEETDVESQTLLPDVIRVGWVSANEFSIERGNNVFYDGSGSYDYILPSIDFDIEVVEDVILRASASQTITRTGYNNLIAGQSIDGVSVVNANGSRGNPGLNPIESTNFDISAEWYYGDASYISLGYFKKDVENFVGTEFVNDSPVDITNPATGQRFDDAVAVVGGNDNVAIRNEIIAQNPGDPNIVPADEAAGIQAIIYGSPENDILDVVFSQPVNQDEAELDGLEFAVQHMFGNSGFGVIVNYTYVDSDLEYDNGSLDGQFALLGLSDSANAVAFYEKDGFQARLAYNWRDEFLDGFSDGHGDGPNPVYVEEYGQLDVNVSYAINDNFTVFAEGINVTDEYSRKHGRHDFMLVNVEQTGPRYNIGAR